jgi:hypothetical protein
MLGRTMLPRTPRAMIAQSAPDRERHAVRGPDDFAVEAIAHAPQQAGENRQPGRGEDVNDAQDHHVEVHPLPPSLRDPVSSSSDVGVPRFVRRPATGSRPVAIARATGR